MQRRVVGPGSSLVRLERAEHAFEPDVAATRTKLHNGRRQHHCNSVFSSATPDTLAKAPPGFFGAPAAAAVTKLHTGYWLARKSGYSGHQSTVRDPHSSL